MKPLATITFVIIITAIAAIMWTSAYKVGDNNRAVITQSGHTVKVVNNAGWHLKIPFLQQVHFMPNTEVVRETSARPLSKDEITNDTRNKTPENPPRKIVQIKPVDSSELNCPTRIVDGVEQVVMQPGMSTMQYNLCNEKIRRIASH